MNKVTNFFLRLSFFTIILLTSCHKDNDDGGGRFHTYYLEVNAKSNWPENLKKQFEDAVSALVSSKKCWSFKNDKAYTLELYSPDNHYGCSKFEVFKSDAQLKPYAKIKSKTKMLISFVYDEKQISSPIRVEKFQWDGEKVYRTANSGGTLRGRSAEDFVVLWSLK